MYSLQIQMQIYDRCSFSALLINDERGFLYQWEIYKYETHKIDLIIINIQSLDTFNVKCNIIFHFTIIFFIYLKNWRHIYAVFYTWYEYISYIKGSLVNSNPNTNVWLQFFCAIECCEMMKGDFYIYEDSIIWNT